MAVPGIGIGTTMSPLPPTTSTGNFASSTTTTPPPPTQTDLFPTSPFPQISGASASLDANFGTNTISEMITTAASLLMMQAAATGGSTNTNDGTGEVFSTFSTTAHPFLALASPPPPSFPLPNSASLSIQSISASMSAATTAAAAVDFAGVPMAAEQIASPHASNFTPIIDDCVFYPSMENYFMILTFSVIFCLSVVGNSIVVVVILQQRSMRSVTNLYLLNLALTDLLLSVVCMPPTLVSSLVYCWVFGDLLCKLLAYLQPVVVTASAYTLAAIALERYYAICRPLHSRVWHTRTHAMFMISLVWLVSVISNVFMLFMYEERTYNHNGLNCSPKFEPVVHFGYQIYMTIVLLVIPLVTMTVLYGNVIRTLRLGINMDIAAIELLENNNVGIVNTVSSTSGAETAGVDEQQQQQQQQHKTGCSRSDGGTPERERDCSVVECGKKRNRLPTWAQRKNEPPLQQKMVGKKVGECNVAGTMPKATVEQRLRSTHSGRTALAKQRLIRMLIVIVVIFFCCWTPSYIWWLLLNAQDTFRTFNIWNSELNTLITVLTYLSSCTNPITYCFLNNKFRNALFLTFGCRSANGSGKSQQQRAFNQSVHSQGGTPRAEERYSIASDANNNVRSGFSTANYNASSAGLSGIMKKAFTKEKKNSPNCCLEILNRTKRAAAINNVSLASPPHRSTPPVFPTANAGNAHANAHPRISAPPAAAAVASRMPTTPIPPLVLQRGSKWHQQQQQQQHGKELLEKFVIKKPMLPNARLSNAAWMSMDGGATTRIATGDGGNADGTMNKSGGVNEPKMNGLVNGMGQTNFRI